MPLTNESDLVAQMEKILTELAHNRDRLEQLRQQGMSYARERLTWDAKAQDTTRVLHWVIGRGPKPDLLPPKALAAGIESSRQITTPHSGSPVPRESRFSRGANFSRQVGLA